MKEVKIEIADKELKVNDGNTFIQIYPTTGSISIKANETTQNAV